MFGRARLLVLLVVAIASPAAAQTDDLDLHQVAIHSAPADVADWPATVTIARLELDEPGGVRITAAIPESWNYHVPGWGDENLTDAQKASCSLPGVDNGCLLYTVWPVVQVNGQWHAAGIIQMWRGKDWTGAPLLTSWNDWAYAPDRWGAMVDYRPAAGDRVGFFVTAGDARGPREATSRRERSNVVLVPLAAHSVVAFDAPAPRPPTDPPPSPGPAPGPTPEPAEETALLREILGRLDVELGGINRLLQTINGRLATLEDQQKADTAAILARFEEVRRAAEKTGASLLERILTLGIMR